LPYIQRCRPDSSFAARKALQAAIEAINPPLNAALGRARSPSQGLAQAAGEGREAAPRFSVVGFRR